MKKTICTILICVFVFGLTACNKEQNKGKVSAGSESKQELQDIENKLDMTIDIVTSNVINGWGEDAINQDFMDKAFAKKNKELGILNYVHLDSRETITDEYDLSTDIYIVEMDSRTDNYKKLEVGKTLSYYTEESVKTFEITAINGQYVLGIRVSEEHTNMEQEPVVQTQPTFTLNNTQGAYDAFLKLK